MSTISSAAVRIRSITLVAVSASMVADSSRNTSKVAIPTSVPDATCADNARMTAREMSAVDVVADKVVVNSRSTSRFAEDVPADVAIVVASSRIPVTSSSMSDNDVPDAMIA